MNLPLSVACIFWWNISDFHHPITVTNQALHHAKSLRNTVILEEKFNFHPFQLVCNPYLHWKTVILLQSSVACIQTNTTNQQFGTIDGVHAWVVSQLVFIVTLVYNSTFSIGHFHPHEVRSRNAGFLPPSQRYHRGSLLFRTKLRTQQYRSGGEQPLRKSGSKHRSTRETKETFVRRFVGRETDQRSNRM